MADKTRIETDSMGEVVIPTDAYWGPQTQRAVDNFPISGYRFGRAFIRAIGRIKKAAANVNRELGRLDAPRADLIVRAADDIINAKLDEQFVIDVFQTGSGTSTNMNANEVISRHAAQADDGTPVHPNDHVNMGQSSNDVIPTAIHLAAGETLKNDLVPALHHLANELDQKAKAFDDPATGGPIVKVGRTHLQDAAPIRLGQEFSGYAAQIRFAANRAVRAIEALRELAIGGTAVGTGINTHPEFGRRVCEKLSQATGIEFVEAANHFEAQGARDAVCETSGYLKTIAVSLTKVANDVRLLSCGPRCGIGEIRVRAVQPGSSSMPGKVNPVMSEMMVMVATQVIGNDTTITLGCRDGHLELNAMLPLIAHNLLESIRLLASAVRVFADRCVAGIEADRERCAAMSDQSLALCTSLVPLIGYDRTALIAKQAQATGRTIREVAAEMGILGDHELMQALDALSMTEPH